MNSAHKTNTAQPRTNAFGRHVGRPVLSDKEERMAREATRAAFERMAAK